MSPEESRSHRRGRLRGAVASVLLQWCGVVGSVASGAASRAAGWAAAPLPPGAILTDTLF